MAIGYLASNTRGSGSRANDGKTPYDLLPLKYLIHYASDLMPWYDRCLIELGNWQARDDTALLRALMETTRGILGIEAYEPAAKVFGFGKEKYAVWNWAKGMPWSVPLGCALRHIDKIQRGEDIDPDSGLPHLGHVQCNLVMLVTFATTYLEGDDRPPSALLESGDEQS